MFGLIEKKYFVHHRMPKFYVRHGMVVDKVHEKIHFDRAKVLKNLLVLLQKMKQS